jgi:hypothetical protein
VDDALLFDARWPPALDPATVPFRTRSATVLRRMGFFDDPSLFNTLTEVEVRSWWNAGVVTVADIRDTGNAAIPRHHEEVARLRKFEADMASLADELWATHIWFKDPRFEAHPPMGDGTVYDIATSGTDTDRESLWESREALRDAVAFQANLTLPDAVAEYVEAITGWHGHRLEMILADMGLDGQDPIGATETARRLGVTRSAVYQARDRLLRNRDRARPSAGIWMPQIEAAERDGWPDGSTEAGIDATRGFFGNEQRGTT